MKLKMKPEKNTRCPQRWALRFFATILLLTLFARGTAGSAMARVTLTKSRMGIIQQDAVVDAVLLAQDGQKLSLPAGIPVEKLWVAPGQVVKQGDPLVQLPTETLRRTLEQEKITLAQQQAHLEQLRIPQDADQSGVDSARRALAQAEEDASREKTKMDATVEQAALQKQTVEEFYADTLAALQELQAQDNPPVGEEVLSEALQKVQQAESARNAAAEALQQAQANREDTDIQTKRQIESARQSLTAADTAFAQATQQAEISKRANEAEAAAIQLSVKDTEERIEQLQVCLAQNGCLYAPHDGQLLRLDLAENTPVPEQNPVMISAQGSALLAEFTLPEQQAKRLNKQASLEIVQGTTSVTATILRSVPIPEEHKVRLTASIASEETESLQANRMAQATLVFSQTEYNNCLPASAIREDAQGKFVYTVEQNKTVFGITNTAVRRPVTVLEWDSAGEYAAIAETISDDIIAGADRALTPGAAVRVQE